MAILNKVSKVNIQGIGYIPISQSSTFTPSGYSYTIKQAQNPQDSGHVKASVNAKLDVTVNAKQLDINAFSDLSDVLITVEMVTGEIYSMESAACETPPSLGDGEFSLTLTAPVSRKIQ